MSERGIPQFDRSFFESSERFTCIGRGQIGGKASGLLFIKDKIIGKLNDDTDVRIRVDIPTLTVLTTELFDLFMERNNLFDIACSDMSDARIADAFIRADFPAEYTGDLMALISRVKRPLAVRSSSMLEDAMYRPFAGVYATKMIPNNQFETAERFHRLIEAVKLVYASTFFKEAKEYIRRTGEEIRHEKMAVVIQEVVGDRYGDRFYPVISGVARSHNFYPTGRGRAEDGVVNLALGLGKTIVDGGINWSYSPKDPRRTPPFGSVRDVLKLTQNTFWAVNMGKPPAYDPLKETEYMLQADLTSAEEDNTLRHVASTYLADSDRLTPTIEAKGPRVLDFAPVLRLTTLPLNDVIRSVLSCCRDAVGEEVEIEFAVSIDPRNENPAGLGLLQVRPMVVSGETVTVADKDWAAPDLLLASDSVLGNGAIDTICDIVYVRPERFERKDTPQIAADIEQVNRRLVESGRQCLLIGFGRWGSSDPWLGIPVNWSQISSARVIVEARLPQINIDFSQGSHFFHNLTSFQVLYFTIADSSDSSRICWDWLSSQECVSETELIRHIQTKMPLRVKVDGRSGRGIVCHGSAE